MLTDTIPFLFFDEENEYPCCDCSKMSVTVFFFFFF